MEENDTSYLSNEEFNETVIPFNRDITTDHYITLEEKREVIRDWVLSICIDSTIERAIPTKPSTIHGDIHEGLFAFDRPKCIVTGYPIANGDVIQTDEQMAAKKDYEQYVEKIGKSPWPCDRMT